MRLLAFSALFRPDATECEFDHVHLRTLPHRLSCSLHHCRDCTGALLSDGVPHHRCGRDRKGQHAGGRADGIKLGSLRISAIFLEPFRLFAAFWAIEITTELLFVGMAIASPLRVLFKPFEGGYEPTPHTTCQARRSTAPS